MTCEPGNTGALAKLFAWMDEHRDEVRQMGLSGKQLIRSDWNYETQFKPVLEAMESVRP